MSQKINIESQMEIGNVILNELRNILQLKHTPESPSIHEGLQNGSINPLNFYLGCLRATMEFTGTTDIQAFLADIQKGIVATEVDSAVEAYYQQQKGAIEKEIGDRAVIDLKTGTDRMPRPPIDIDNLPISERMAQQPPEKSPDDQSPDRIPVDDVQPEN